MDLLGVYRPGTMVFMLKNLNFAELGQGAERATVHGPALTYEDFRGFIASNKYRFRSLKGAPEQVRILACPRTPALADALGYSSIELTLDPEQEIVQRAKYRGLSRFRARPPKPVESPTRDCSTSARRTESHCPRAGSGFSRPPTRRRRTLNRNWESVQFRKTHVFEGMQWEATYRLDILLGS